MGIEKFEQLDVWQEAHSLVLHVYRITSTMPSDQRFGLISQMQRAAVSIPANIAEGFSVVVAQTEFISTTWHRALLRNCALTSSSVAT